MNSIATGWYPNPDGPGERYWDGGAWTSSTRPSPPPPPPPAPARHDSGRAGGIVTAGYVFAVLVPFVGFILGIVASTKDDRATSKHGVWIILVSVVVFIVALAVISSSSTSSSGSGSSQSPKAQFAGRCGSCHTLVDAGTSGTFGPDLDDLRPDKARVLAALKAGPGGMPAGLLEGAQADAVAGYVASVAGR